MSSKIAHKNNAHSETLGIQAVAEHFDITPRAIRFYEDKGLLQPHREGSVRVFGPEDMNRLDRILRAKRLGFTLDDIKTVLDVTDGLVGSREELSARKADFKKAIKSLERRRKDIDLVVQDMSVLCDSIEAHLSTTKDDNGVFYLANAYQAKFDSHFDDDGLAQNTKL